MYTVLQWVIGKVGVVLVFFTLMTNPIKLFLKYLEISAQCIGSLLVSWRCCSGELCGSWVLCFYLKKTTTRGSIEENQRRRFNLARKRLLRIAASFHWSIKLSFVPCLVFEIRVLTFCVWLNEQFEDYLSWKNTLWKFSLKNLFYFYLKNDNRHLK